MKSIIPIWIFLSFCKFSFSQEICKGNLGENIFERGDFGNGVSPVLAIDPNIAPGYNYTTNVPSDGSYTICSNTGALNGLYPTWIQTTDNSNDPDGYMMVVNASYEPGIFYEELVEGLCENTLYEFSADILNLIKIGTPNHIDPNVSFLIDNAVVYNTGNIPKTEAWKQFGFSFVTNSTQSSIKLTLRNNAPGGVGNDLALDNISFRPCGPSSFIDILSDTTIFLCIDDDPLTVIADIEATNGQVFAVQWQSSTDGINWQTVEDSVGASITHTNFNPGNYFYRYYSSGNAINILNAKCRIISDELKLTILPDTYEVNDTICNGLTYIFGNQQLTSSGLYIENFESQYGCDSIVLLELVFIDPQKIEYEIELIDPSCFGFQDGIIEVNSITGGNGGLSSFIMDENNTLINSSFPSGNYNLVVVDKFDCTDSFEVQLFDPPEIYVSLGEDILVRLGDEIEFYPDYSKIFTSVTWEGHGDFSCLGCENPNFIPYFTGKVKVIVKDEGGCETEDSITVSIDDQNIIFLPNIFTPNDDKINDFVTINYYGKSVSEVLSFAIYDRWGGLIYTTKNIKLESGAALWNGYKQSEMADLGVYTYDIEVLLVNNVIIYEIGNVTLLK